MYEIADIAIAFIPRQQIEEPVLWQIEILPRIQIIHRRVAGMPDCRRDRGATASSDISCRMGNIG